MESLTETAIQSDQQFKLIDGYFTPSEAAEIINNALRVKINFHKEQRISKTERNLNDTCEHESTRIDALRKELETSKAFFKESRLKGKKLKVTSTIHITIED